MKPPLILILFLLLPFTLVGQDTLRLSLQQADQLLVERNLDLIVSHYEVDKATARRVQAGLFLNPELSTEWNLYNPERRRFSDVGHRGQKIIALEQVFRIAGQRNAAVRLAEAERGMTELQYFELVRSLKFQLHFDYYHLYYLQETIRAISSQLNLLQEIVALYDQQYKKGNISLKEYTRLRTAYFQLSNERAGLEREVINLQQSLKILLAEERVLLPTPELDDPATTRKLMLSLALLQEKAENNRIEMKIAGSLYQQNELRYSLERKNAVPNLAAGVLYDQAGSYVNNYSAITLGIQIPIFNRNQGAIQEAKVGMAQASTFQKSSQQRIKAEVEGAWYQLQVLQQQHNQLGDGFSSQLDQLSEGLVENYLKKNISLLEFTDLFESYNSSIIEINKLKVNLINAYEELNYAVGESVL
jgi:cobalt-zinc-cadmium efflux system outer membrane protein